MCATLFHVYIIQSEVNDSFYIGYSSDPFSRLIKHNTSSSGYTASKKPWRLVYIKSFLTKAEALKAEKFIKRQKSKPFIIKLIESDENQI